MNLDTTGKNVSTKCAFISHSSPDDRYVAEFVQLVRSLGFDEVFNDSHTIAPDAKFWERIEQGIRECDAFVLILSHSSVKSQWVNKEVEFARRNDKRVIPVRIDDCPLPSSFDDRDVIELKLNGKAQRISRPRFLHHAAELFLGRETELEMLDRAWARGVNVLSLIAWGGVGKTSLMAEWVQTRFIDQQWKDAEDRPNPLAYFDWSFYDQGTGSLEGGSSVRTGNVGDFFEQALKFFGDRNPSEPSKGSRLAELVREQRTLFILDGLEPLQHPVGHARAGRLIDPDLRDFLVALAAANPGLCLITSRQAVTDLHGLHGRAAESRDLDDLPKSVAVRLLRMMQVVGSDKELEEATKKFGCHALSLTLLGRFLVDAHGGDIRRIDRVKDLHRADDLTREERHRTAKRVLATYDEWLSTAQADGNPRTLAVLRLTGLFDRAATSECLSSLRAKPVIPGLTEAICGMHDEEWNVLLKRLDRIHLIKLLASNADEFGIDAHPLVREYFAHKLKQTEPQAWKMAHARLFRHLCETTKEGNQPTLEDLQPLYQAIAHGCESGRQQEAYQQVLISRIQQGTFNYSLLFLGSAGDDLTALSHFYEEPWQHVSSSLTDEAQSWILGATAFCLRALGRVSEAMRPALLSAERWLLQDEWRQASIAFQNLYEIQSRLGYTSDSILSTERAVYCATKVDDWVEQRNSYSALGDALLVTNSLQSAGDAFDKAERLQIQGILLHSLPGFRYCDLLLSLVERTVWQVLLKADQNQRTCNSHFASNGERRYPSVVEVARGILIGNVADVAERAQMSLVLDAAVRRDFDIALDLMVLARAGVYASLLGAQVCDSVPAELISYNFEQAIRFARRASMRDYLPSIYLPRAIWEVIQRDSDSALADLDEAWDIAERDSMRLYMADIHLYRARLFFREKTYPWKSPQDDLAAAEKLINECGYHRRDQELTDAKRVILAEVT